MPNHPHPAGGVANPAAAATLGFGCITNNSPIDCTIAEAQLFVDVTDAGGGQVLFTFSNLGPASSSITDVYFDDGSLLAIALVSNSPGVDFSQLASPANLPGGATPARRSRRPRDSRRIPILPRSQTA